MKKIIFPLQRHEELEMIVPVGNIRPVCEEGYDEEFYNRFLEFSKTEHTVGEYYDAEFELYYRPEENNFGIMFMSKKPLYDKKTAEFVERLLEKLEIFDAEKKE